MTKTYKNYRYKIINKINNTRKIYKKIKPTYISTNISDTKEKILVKREKKIIVDKRKDLIDYLKHMNNPQQKNKYNPKDDYYSYINNKWLNLYNKEHKIDYTTVYDEFRIVQDNIYYELNDIFQKAILHPSSRLNKCMKNAYISLTKLNTQQQQQCVANHIVQLIDEYRQNKENVWDILGFFNSNELITVGCPFQWMIQSDNINRNIYSCYINPPAFSLLDTSVYFEDNINTNYKNQYRKRYKQYLSELFENAFGKDHLYDVDNIYRCEQKLVMCLVSQTEQEQEQEQEPEPEQDNTVYYRIKSKEAYEKYHFDWKKFAKSMGIENIPNEFITININYLSQATRLLLEEWNDSSWREFWIYLYIKQQQRFQDKGRYIYYSFFGIYQNKLTDLFDDMIKPVFFMCYFFPTFINKAYIEKNYNPDIEKYVSSFAQELLTVFIELVRNSKWLSKKTRLIAIDKLKNMNFIIGRRKLYMNDPILDYEADDAWGNIVKKSLWRHNISTRLIGKKIIAELPVIDWSATPPNVLGNIAAYSVNAYYLPTQNDVVISMGYLRPPFVDINKSIEYNLAEIGFTIAHEMSHALDNIGSNYTKNGIYKNWWTETDKKKYHKIQEDLVKQYETFAKRDGLQLNGWLAIGEDLADLSGFQICEELLLKINKDTLPIKKIDLETFYVYYAIQHKQLIKNKAIDIQLRTNPHPMNKYRTNVILSRSLIFREMYNIKKEDKMWWWNLQKIW